MTRLLEQAFRAVSQLPEDEQDALAAALLAEVAAERRWPAAFEGTEDVLSTLADEALEEHRSGRTEPLDPDRH